MRSNSAQITIDKKGRIGHERNNKNSSYGVPLLDAATLLTTHLLLNTKLGYSFIAIREDEDAAGSVGINTTLSKTSAFVLSGFFTGLAGSISA